MFLRKLSCRTSSKQPGGVLTGCMGMLRYRVQAGSGRSWGRLGVPAAVCGLLEAAVLRRRNPAGRLSAWRPSAPALREQQHK